MIPIVTDDASLEALGAIGSHVYRPRACFRCGQRFGTYDIVLVGYIGAKPTELRRHYVFCPPKVLEDARSGWTTGLIPNPALLW